MLFSDTDVVVTRDPMTHMIWRNMDYVFSINHVCPYDDQFVFHGCRPLKCLEGNTGTSKILSTTYALTQLTINDRILFCSIE